MMGTRVLVALAAGVFVLRPKRSTELGVVAPDDPTDPQSYVIAECRRWKVSETLAFAIVEQESAWNPAARSKGPSDEARGGAWGLFQMTYLTALEQDDRNYALNRSTNWRTVSPSRLPEALYAWGVNIELGVSHLAHLLSIVGPDFRRVAAAYNGGPGTRNAAALLYADNVLERIARLEQEGLV